MEIGSEEEVGWECFDWPHRIYFDRPFKCLHIVPAVGNESSMGLFEMPTAGLFMVWLNEDDKTWPAIYYN